MPPHTPLIAGLLVAPALSPAQATPTLAPIIEDGGDLQQAYEIDQSPYSQLATFDILARQNAGRIFRAMEFE